MELIITFLFILISLGNLSYTQSQDLFPVSIIHINDFHARFDEINSNSVTCNREKDVACYGGYARVITVVKELMASRAAENKNPIYLNAADNFQGTLWYNIYRGNATSYFLNLYPADAMTLGNHEFDHKIEGLIPFMEAITSPIIVCNIDDSEEPTFQGLYEKSIIIDRYERKIGIIGVILETTYDLSDTGKLKFLNETESVKKEAALLKAQGVDIIIALSHCGVDIDIEMAEKVGSDVDVIVGGHTHSFLWTGDDYPGERPVGEYPTIITHDDGHKVLVVQASAYTKYMGDLTVYFDAAGEVKEWEGKPIFLDESIEQDQEILDELAPWRVQVDLIGLQEIGLSKVDLSNSGCNVGETNIGSLIADSYVNAYMDQDPEEGSWAVATIAFTNCGGIRSSLGKGSLNYGDFVGVTPFDNTLDIMKLTGKTIREALEHAVNEATPEDFYSYNQVQVSGLKIVYNVTNPVGEKVVSVKILCNKCVVPEYLPLDEEEIYSAIVPSFIAGGKDGFTMLLDHKGHQPGRILDIDGFINYVTATTPVYQSKSGRITLVK